MTVRVLKGIAGGVGKRLALLLGVLVCYLMMEATWAQAVPASPASQAEAAPEPADTESAATAEPDKPGGNAVDRSKPVAWQLNIEAPSPLDKLLHTYLDLARFQEESSKDQSLGIRRSELRRLVISAPEQARALLEAQGYLNANIVTSVSDDRS